MNQVSVRAARQEDAEAIAALIVELGYDVTAAQVRERLALLESLDQSVLVAGGHQIVGVLTTSRMATLHRAHPVGRISMLVVAEAQRGRGIGAALVAAAEASLRAQGCSLIEVTSNLTRERAHRFYEQLGYERTSARFGKALL